MLFFVLAYTSQFLLPIKHLPLVCPNIEFQKSHIYLENFDEKPKKIAKGVENIYFVPKESLLSA